jgi:hypothetical protein
MKNFAIAVIVLGFSNAVAHAEGPCKPSTAVWDGKAIIANVYPGNGELTATYDVTTEVVTVNSANGHEWQMVCDLGEADCGCAPETQLK